MGKRETGILWKGIRVLVDVVDDDDDDDDDDNDDDSMMKKKLKSPRPAQTYPNLPKL